MCRDQNLISETDGRADKQTSERMKIEKPGVGRPLLGQAKMVGLNGLSCFLTVPAF